MAKKIKREFVDVDVDHVVHSSKRVRVLKAYTPYWRRLAFEEMEAQTSLTACRNCGMPVAGPYCCNRCGCIDP